MPTTNQRCHQEQTQSARSLLESITPRMDDENAQLATLIPRAKFASDLVRLLGKYPYGFLHQDAQRAREQKSKELLASGMIIREGEDFNEIGAMEEQAMRTINELLEQATEAEARLR